MTSHSENAHFFLNIFKIKMVNSVYNNTIKITFILSSVLQILMTIFQLHDI